MHSFWQHDYDVSNMPFLGNIGGAEMMIIGIIALLFFGGKKMNDVARGLGESTKEMKKIQKEFHAAVNEDLTDLEIPKETKHKSENTKNESAT